MSVTVTQGPNNAPPPPGDVWLRIDPLPCADGPQDWSVPGAVSYGWPNTNNPCVAEAHRQVQAAGYTMRSVTLYAGYAVAWARARARTTTPTADPTAVPRQPVQPTTAVTTRPTVQPTIRPTVQPTSPTVSQVTADPVTTVGTLTALWAGIKALFGAFTRWDGWVKLSPNTDPATVWKQAGQAAPDVYGVGRLIQDAPGRPEEVNWIARQSNRDYAIIGTDSIGPGDLVPDVRIPLAAARQLVDLTYPEGAFEGGSGTGPPSTTSSGTGQIAYGALSQLLGVPPTRPRTVTVRRCGKGMMLGIDGACYPTRLLTVATRMNKSKKAVISYREGQTINKAKTARRRIRRLAAGIEAEAKDETHHVVHHRRKKHD